MSAPVKAIVCFNLCAQDDDAIGLGEAIALGEVIPCQTAGLPGCRTAVISVFECY